jgi:hypothetical protein
LARGFFTGDYIGLAAKIGVGENQSGEQTTGGNNNEGEGTGFVPIFVMTNCTDNSCAAVGTPDGTPAGPDSTDAFTSGST